MLTRLLSLCVALALAPVAALADPAATPTDLDLSQVLAAARGGMPGGDEEEAKPYPDFKDVTKDMESKEGLFTLWYYPPEAKDKDQEKLLCQIPAGFLGEKFMLSTSFSGGGFLTGFPLDEHVVRWELLGKQLLLMEPETRFVVDTSKEVSDVVRRTYPDRIRAAVPLVTKSPGGDPVIDLGALLKSDFANIGWMSSFFMGDMGGGGGGINRALSKWIKKKTFPLNVEIGVELAVGRPYPSGSYDKKLVHYSFWNLPKSDYSPRIADDRVGYFLTANQDWSKPTDSRDIFNRYVDRWHLVKRDPSLPLCEPKKPIIFYIEKTVPVRFRRAVRDGILEWNKAFEKCGFLNAVEVRQQTDDPEFGWANLDPEDMRYSFFRWIVTGFGFAMGPHRGNPFTGQIYDADIIFDDSMVRYFEQSAQQRLPNAAMTLKMRDSTLQDFLQKFPQWKRPTREWEGILYGPSDEQEFREAIRAHLRHSEHPCCDYAEGMKHQMALAHAVLAGQPPEVIDRYLYDVVKEVVMHEVGHTLGLRHNFKASTVYSIEEIQKRRDTGEATVGSVMDYNPALFFAKNATEGHFITPTIGPYDYWAIEYGYRPYDGNYKSHNAKGAEEEEGKEEPSDEAADEPAAEGSASVEVALENIPADVLEQLPPEVKKMLESGSLAAAMKAHGHGPSKGPADTAVAKPVAGEEAMLREIAGRATEPELAYGTDEDATFLGPDPRIVRFDMGSDPVEWAETRFDMINQRMADILDWAVKDQESWYYLRQAFLSLLAEKAFVMDYVGRYIGGEYFNRAHRGDENAEPPFVLVDAKTQRNALEFIEKNLFSDDFFQFSPEVLNHLAPSRWRHADSYVSYTMDFPIHDIIGILQWWNLFDRLFPTTLRRIHDNELKTDEADKLTVAEYIQRVQAACWGDTCDAARAKAGKWTDAKPFVSDVRRSLQREYLSMMEPLVRIPPGQVLSPDIHAMLRHSLQQLADEIDAILKSGAVDFASAAHLQECKSRIERMLKSELREYD